MIGIVVGGVVVVVGVAVAVADVDDVADVCIGSGVV